MDVDKIRCELCKHWKETNFQLRIGDCTLFGYRTEACAGIKWQLRNRVRVCEGFDPINATVDNIDL